MISDNQQAAVPDRDASGRSSIGGHLLHYIPSVFVRTVAGVVNTIVRPKLLSPHWFGMWSLLNVIPAYASYLHMGSRDYMRFAIPRLSAKQDHGEIRRIEASVFWGGLFPNLGVALALVGLSLVSSFSFQMRVGLAGFAVIVVLTCLYEYGVNLMKGHQMFRELSVAMYLRNLSLLVFSVILMLLFGFYGLLVAVPASLLLALAYMLMRYPFLRVGPFVWPVYRTMVREGFPLALFAFLMTLLLTSGRLLIAAALSPEEVGYYALGTLVLRGMLAFPGATREVVEPRIMEDVDVMEQAEMLERYLYRPLVLNACLLSLIIAPLYFFLPALISWLLPLYVQGIAPLRVMLFGFYFMSLIYPLRGIIVARGIQRSAAIVVGLCVVLNLGLSWGVLQMGYGIREVAVANALCYAVLLFAMAALLRVVCGIRFLVARLWPLLVVFVFLCLGVWGMASVPAAWIGKGLLGGVLRASLIFLLAVAGLLYADRRWSLLHGASPLSLLKRLARRRSARLQDTFPR